MKYKLTEKGVQEARKKRTVAKGLGEAVTFGGPWKREEYSNILLVTLAGKPSEERDVPRLTREAFNPPRPRETTVARSLRSLVHRGFVTTVPSGRSSRNVYSDRQGTRMARRRPKGWKRIF
jgi:DNA-binding PadR family transcriptional regulator